jgi:hypothetical protein
MLLNLFLAILLKNYDDNDDIGTGIEPNETKEEEIIRL